MEGNVPPEPAEQGDFLMDPRDLAPYAQMAEEQCGLVTEGDPGMRRALETLVLNRRSQGVTTLFGEPGTGKELCAHLVHRLKNSTDRNDRERIVPVNVAGVSEKLFQDELFGHARGSYTGAEGERSGRFEQAGNGTIFLDEIGHMRLDDQCTLLRALEQRTFSKVGDNRELSLEANIVCATNADLRIEVEQGRFRRDLYDRLCSGCVVSLPSLSRRRPDHRAALIRRFLESAGGYSVDSDAFRFLMEAPVQGNVRGLKNLVHRAAMYAKETQAHCISVRHARRAFEDGRQVSTKEQNGWAEKIGAAALDAAVHGGLRFSLSRVKQEVAHAFMERNGNNATQVARMLNIDRSTLARLLHEREARMREGE